MNKDTLDDTDVIYAALLDTPAADAFAGHLSLTLDMTDYANREKHAHLDFSIDDSDLENIQYPYEIGVIYGSGAWQFGDIQGNPAMQEAYQMGKNIC